MPSTNEQESQKDVSDNQISRLDRIEQILGQIVDSQQSSSSSPRAKEPQKTGTFKKTEVGEDKKSSTKKTVKKEKAATQDNKESEVKSVSSGQGGSIKRRSKKSVSKTLESLLKQNQAFALKLAALKNDL
jgi:hypothetical protein